MPTAEEKIQRRESLLHSGLITPIIITIDSNGKAFIVDGNLRYNLIRELKKEGNWSDSLPVLKISLDKAKVYRGIQTNHKNYTKFQLAIFGAYNYWDEVEKDSLLRRQQGKKASGKKGKTSEIVGCMSGVNEKYAQYAHELLEIDAEFFYNTFFIKRYSLKKNSIKELISLFKTDKKRTLNIIEKMKELVENPLLQCEKEPVQLKILRETFPSIIKHNDILTLSKEVFDYYGIDTKNCAFVGGAPCQKHSHANPRRAEQLESKLLAQLVRLTYHCRPRFVLVENVYGFIDDPNGTTWLSSRMETIGYFGQILCFPAQALGAPHKRERIFALYCRDKLLPNSDSQLRYMGEFATHKISQTVTPGIWHGRFVAQSGIQRVAYGHGRVPESVKKCLEIIGNGVVYDVGLFIGKSLKIFNDYFYDSPEGRLLKKVPYNPY